MIFFFSVLDSLKKNWWKMDYQLVGVKVKNGPISVGRYLFTYLLKFVNTIIFIGVAIVMNSFAYLRNFSKFFRNWLRKSKERIQNCPFNNVPLIFVSGHKYVIFVVVCTAGSISYRIYGVISHLGLDVSNWPVKLFFSQRIKM